MADTYAELLRTFRTRARLSLNGLSKRVGLDPSYMSRLESQTRGSPGEQVALAIANIICRDNLEQNQMLVAAGHAPLDESGERYWDPCLGSVFEILTAQNIDQEDRMAFRDIVQQLARKWAES